MNSTPSSKTRSVLAIAALTFASLSPSGAQLAGQLGVLDLGADGGINPTTGAPWAEGDNYRLVFITSTTTQATSTDIATYNSFVQLAASGSTAFPKLGNALWKVAGSTQDVDARDNTGTNPEEPDDISVPIYLMDGTTLFAANNGDLWNGAEVGVQLDETGAPYTTIGDGRVFTGSTGGGVEEVGADQFLGSTVVRTGGATNTGGLWMRIFSDNPEGSRSVYALSQPLTVVDLSDTTAPSLVSIEDDKSGGPVEVPETVVFTVTFNEAMSAGTVNTGDFENASATAITIDSLSPTADPAAYELTVTTTEAGTLQLQIGVGAQLRDLAGNLLDTTSPLTDDTVLTVGQDVNPPTLVSIADNVAGGPIVAGTSMTPRYTVTFSEPIDATTLAADDFENGSSAPTAIGGVSPTADPAIFEVAVTTSGAGELVLQIKANATINDLAGNPLDSSVPLADDTTIVVDPAPELLGQLGVLDVVNANGGINPATGAPWAAGDTYRLVFITSTTTQATSTDITTYNSFVQLAAAGSTSFPQLGDATWKVAGSTQDVDARDNTGTNPEEAGDISVPIYLMDGTTLFAADNGDLWNGANVGVQFDENGAPYTTVGDGRVFTGSTAGGVEEVGADQFLGSTVVRTGGATNTGATWMRIFSDDPEGARSVFAISEPLTVLPSTAAAPRITSINALGAGTFELTLFGEPLTGYEFLSSPDLVFDPGTLVEPLSPGVAAIGTIGGTNNSVLITDANGDGTVRMSLAGPRNFVVAQVPPPVVLLDESFDEGVITPALPANWTTGFDPVDTLQNTVWSLGAPAAPGPASANSGTNCMGTNLAAKYGVESLTWLRTPAIDLTSADAATLSFQQWVDMDDFDFGDTGTVRVLDATALPTVSVLETLEMNIQGLSPTKWVEFSADLTAASLGNSVVIEFLFDSDDFAADDASGWYIDDVRLTAPGF